MTLWRWVTNEMYLEFIRASGHEPPPYWIGCVPHVGTEGFPVTMVSANDADAYCRWAKARLPTDDEAAAMDADRPPFLFEWTATEDASSRVVRGGSWAYLAPPLRASLRFWDVPSFRSVYVGFRCASHPPPGGKGK